MKDKKGLTSLIRRELAEGEIKREWDRNEQNRQGKNL